MNVQSWDLADALVVGLAAASAFKLATTDTLTQRLRYFVVKRLRRPEQVADSDVFVMVSRNRAAAWLEYLWGCGLCFPMWAAIACWVTYDWTPGRFITYLLSSEDGRMDVIRWMNEHNMRDWPEGYDWPPPESPSQPS